MTRFLSLWLSGFLLALTASAADPPKALLNLPYLDDGNDHHRLNLYLPADDGKTHPLLIWLHGGGWSWGSKSFCPPATLLVGNGYAVASVEYRFTQQAIFPAQIEDCKAAVRWLRAHAAEYHLDKDHFGAAGESAGGHLVALLGTTGRQRRYDVGGNLDQSSAVQCVIDLYGANDLLHWGELSAETYSDSPDTMLAKLVGGPIHTHQEAARAASPVYYADKDSAPFLILHGDKDQFAPVQQSQAMHDALVKAGAESTLKILPGAGHSGPAFAAPEILKLMGDFLEKHLRPAVAPVP